MKFVVGLTGGIGSGKSAAANYFHQLGIDIVDADQIAREVVKPESLALEKISEKLGYAILLQDGNLNRKALREIIFNDAQQKKWLENLLHPIIRQEIIRQLNQASSVYSILVSPLLLETDQYQLVDRVLVIDAEESLQIKRATERDQCSSDQIKSIIATQMKRSERTAQAQDIIHNHGNLNELHNQIEKLHTNYLALAQTKSLL